MYIHIEGRVIYMTAIIQKWGNSQGIRIPKHLLKEVNWTENDEVEITARGDMLILRKKQRERPSIEELFKNFKGETLCSEYDWGKSSGEEIW